MEVHDEQNTSDHFNCLSAVDSGDAGHCLHCKDQGLDIYLPGDSNMRVLLVPNEFYPVCSEGFPKTLQKSMLLIYLVHIINYHFFALSRFCDTKLL